MIGSQLSVIVIPMELDALLLLFVMFLGTSLLVASIHLSLKPSIKLGRTVKKKYRIALKACHNQTVLELSLSDEEALFLRMIAVKTRMESEQLCQPVMELQSVHDHTKDVGAWITPTRAKYGKEHHD